MPTITNIELSERELALVALMNSHRGRIVEFSSAWNSTNIQFIWNGALRRGSSSRLFFMGYWKYDSGEAFEWAESGFRLLQRRVHTPDGTTIHQP